MSNLPLHNLIEYLIVVHDLLLVALLNLVKEYQIVVGVEDLAHQKLGDSLVADERLVTDFAPYPHQLVLEARRPQNAVLPFLLYHGIAVIIEIGLAERAPSIPLFDFEYLFLDHLDRVFVAVDCLHAPDYQFNEVVHVPVVLYDQIDFPLF